eukprot:TRINITY_DN9078_c0_g1_i11.p1 TRINITY_DN9078_c0_g1~~TRINITY_DN9078_c0_g1_i11.p1  ORF type:complete len:206 (+),score=49.04 TRINITY_DN9078_c0_g1_i11:1147-1764(+)
MVKHRSAQALAERQILIKNGKKQAKTVVTQLQLLNSVYQNVSALSMPRTPAMSEQYTQSPETFISEVKTNQDILSAKSKELSRLENEIALIISKMKEAEEEMEQDEEGGENDQRIFLNGIIEILGSVVGECKGCAWNIVNLSNRTTLELSRLEQEKPTDVPISVFAEAKELAVESEKRVKEITETATVLIQDMKLQLWSTNHYLL